MAGNQTSAQRTAAHHKILHAGSTEAWVRAADSVGNSASFAQLLIAWQHTAEVHADPDPPPALTRDHGEDYGPAPDPRDVT
ncbi:hypothetical protein [Streptomyces sp. NPDC001833]|uniref:hypothetical protein n=1 Tax=Streptomyces sp. NPDC001833 TaxID=3154658 RepID=UPI00331C0D7C